ncbi:HPr family phosphocarrier protein [Desulfolithobacter sp.]
MSPAAEQGPEDLRSAEKVLERECVVCNARGVHGRVAAALARVVLNREVAIRLIRDREDVDCGSILDILSLALVAGTRVTIRAEGKDAALALEEVVKILEQEKDP